LQRKFQRGPRALVSGCPQPVFAKPRGGCAHSFPLAIGLRLTLGFLTPIRLPSGASDRDKGEAKEGDKPLRKGAPVWALLWAHLLLLVVPLLWLAFGWVVHLYL
jgi:hypothetical protein